MTGNRDKLITGFSKAVGQASRSEIERYVIDGHADLPESGELLAWDANSVHGFVFDTTNAMAIRGASHILTDLDDDLRKGKPIGLDASQILFAGGGSGLAVVSTEQGEKAISKLHQLFTERTLVATCCAAKVDLGAGKVPFNELYDSVRNALARERVRLGSDAEAAVSFFAQRCQVCGRRSALEKFPRQSGTRPECQACYHCIEEGKKQRHGLQEVSGFEEIADKGGFLSVVYIDGNGMGRRISRLPSPLAYAAFSRAIDHVLRKSVKSVAEKYGLEDKEKRNYQLPICGGDDVVAIVPGDMAVPFARDLLTAFEQAADAEPDLPHAAFADLPPMGAAAGVAIGKATFPIRHLIQEAEDLLDSAKERVYRDPRNVRSALDFSEVTDGSPRRESTKAERLESSKDVYLSGRPYALQELKTFSDRFGKVRRASLGRSQLYSLRGHARAGHAQLRNHVLYQIGRRWEWRQLVEQLAGADVVRDKKLCLAQFVHDYNGDAVFDIADMIELYNHWNDAEESEA